MDELVKDCQKAMDKRLEGLDRELSRVRTGRASVNLLDGVRINYYGNPTPLNQVATLSTPDARTIVISPFEKKLISDIERAIQVADLGIQPVNDGNVVRLAVPPLNEERRKEIAKSIKKLGEEAKVGIRKVRQDFNTKIKKSEKAKEIAEDDSKKLQKDIQSETDAFIKKIDERMSKKEQEILTL
ncbi:MAG: ribosome recycling factor [Oligoflexales bacterium]|nr:ribosome recycling factor [Oligoflexales bacterium]